MPWPVSRNSRRPQNAFAAVQPEQLSALAFGVFAGAVFIAGLLLTDAHSVRTLFAADEHGLIAAGALFVMLAWLFAILAFAIKILPDEGQAGWGELKPVRLSRDKPRRLVRGINWLMGEKPSPSPWEARARERFRG